MLRTVMCSIGVLLCVTKSVYSQDEAAQTPTTRLYVDETRIVRTEMDIGTVDSSNPTVCEAKLISPRQISITGRGHGRCYLSLVPLDVFAGEAADDSRNVQPVVVTTDPKKFEVLEEFLRAQIPEADIQLIPDPSSDRVLIRGSVRDRHTSEFVERLVAGANRRPEQVINLLASQESLDELIEQRFPGRKIRVFHAAGSKEAIVSGQVQSASEAQQVQSTVRRALPNVEVVMSLNVAVDSQWIESQLKKMYPEANLSFKEDQQSLRITLSGSPTDSREADDIRATVAALGMPKDQIIDRLEYLQDTRVLERFLQTEFPYATITVVNAPASDRLVVRGNLSSRDELDRLWAIVEGAGVPPDYVVDLIRVTPGAAEGSEACPQLSPASRVPLNYRWTPRNVNADHGCVPYGPPGNQNLVVPPQFSR